MNTRMNQYWFLLIKQTLQDYLSNSVVFSVRNTNKILENTTILKCTGCGLSDTRLNS